MPKARLCRECGDNLPEFQTGICGACLTDLRRDVRLGQEKEHPSAFVPAPPNGRHIAGAPDAEFQRCTRCGCVLAAFVELSTFTVVGKAYPEGAIVERGNGWQAMYVGPKPADCKEESWPTATSAETSCQRKPSTPCASEGRP